MDRVYAWGHPDGLERGQNWTAYEEMIAGIPNAKAIGADVMRVVGSSLMFRHEPHGPQIEALVEMFKKAVEVAKDAGVRLAVENHIDFTSDEILQLLTEVDSEYFGLNFDTGNFLRLLDDPIKGMEKLAPYVLATHVKDLMPDKTARPTDWHFFAGVPVGQGLIDNQTLAQLLQKAGFKGFLAVEIDHPHTDWTGCEDEAVALSIKELKRIAASAELVPTCQRNRELAHDRDSSAERGGRREESQCGDHRNQVHGQGPQQCLDFRSEVLRSRPGAGPEGRLRAG